MLVMFQVNTLLLYMTIIQSYIPLQKITMNSNKNCMMISIQSHFGYNQMILPWTWKQVKPNAWYLKLCKKSKTKNLILLIIIKVFRKHQPINTLDQTFNASDHLTKTYKKATGCLNLVWRLWTQLTVKAAITIYQWMLIPLFTYCSTVTGRTSRTCKHKVEWLQLDSNPQPLSS